MKIPKRKPLKKRRCLVCNKSYKPKIAAQKYCRPYCNVRAYLYREREKAIKYNEILAAEKERQAS